MYDKILMSDNAVKFLTKECGMDINSALKFLRDYKKSKEYEDLALSIEIDTSVIKEVLHNMRDEVAKKVKIKKGK